MVCNDESAARFIQIAVAAGRRIPHDLAVIGADDIPLCCESAAVPLSSIPADYRQVGMEAMALLDRQMRGESATVPMILVPPLAAVGRRYTDMGIYKDPDVTAALGFIRSYACEGIGVHQVLDHVAMSRTQLGRLFSRYVGHSPSEEIHRVRLETAKRLLLETDLSATEVAQQSGFCSQSHLTLNFRKAFGQPPRRFRMSSRAQ